ncbi:MAG: nucleoside hydrolase [Lachnospirales bacterium]
MKKLFEVPREKCCRVIICSDTKIEADDQYAIVHALLTPSFIIEGIVATHFSKSSSVKNGYVNGSTMEKSYDEIIKILKLMDLKDAIPVYHGAETYLQENDVSIKSEGASFILEKSKEKSDLPLYILCLGAITDLACAYLLEKNIEDKFTILWIGGNNYPKGGAECNLSQDIIAANIIFSSNISLWQIPLQAYRNIRVSIAELLLKVKPFGEIGNYLYKQLIEFNNERAKTEKWLKGESWCLGDSLAISLLIDEDIGCYSMQKAPFVLDDCTYVSNESNENNRLILVYDYVDSRFTLEDFFSKLELYTKQNNF